MKIEVIFLINDSRKLSKITEETILLAKSDKNLNCQLVRTKFQYHAIDLAKEYTDKGSDIIVAVGGDGTCNEVVNGISASKFSGKVLFAIIPNGSGNDFQSNLDSFSPNEFVKNLVRKKHNSIDLIKVRNGSTEKYSLNIAGVGFDGFVVNTLNNLRGATIFKGKVAYSIAILKSFIFYKKSFVKIETEDFFYHGKLLLVAICNGKSFGHGLIISPNSRINDGKLQVVLFGNVSFWDYLKNLKNLKRGRMVQHENVHYTKTTFLRLETERELFIEIDGEMCGNGQVEFEVVPRCLKLIS
jgi:YegS/Rv2252/BmrU family lipid kinase